MRNLRSCGLPIGESVGDGSAGGFGGQVPAGVVSLAAAVDFDGLEAVAELWTEVLHERDHIPLVRDVRPLRHRSGPLADAVSGRRSQAIEDEIADTQR